jgi:type II secretory pathway component PulF
MERFVYKAKKGLEEVVEGTIDAENKEEVLSILLEKGLFPIFINKYTPAEVRPPSTVEKIHKIKRKKIKKRISSKEILIFTQKLTTLIRAKVELLLSLRILYEQMDNIKFQEAVLDIYNTIKEGKTFSEALEHFPGVFSPLFVNLIKAGEASGRLDSSLEQISEFMFREESLRTKIYVALAYPMLLLFVGLASIFILINFVIPHLKPIFEGLGKDLPFITKVILNFSSISYKNIWIVITFIVVLFIFGLYSPKGNYFFRDLIERLKRGIPIVKRLTQNQELAHFSRALAMLLKGGVPALSSLEIATPSISNRKLREEFKKVCQGVASGQELSKCMEAFTRMPAFFIKMVQVGEESGRLTEVLEEIAQSYTQQIEADIALITSLIEPVLILALGIIMGGIVLSILLPTFQITQIVH